jgi:hypothetical protein
MLGVVNWCFDRKVAATLLADMNGVIHNCSHGSDTDINTRMTEDEMVGGDLLLCRWAALSLFSVGGFFICPLTRSTLTLSLSRPGRQPPIFERLAANENPRKRTSLRMLTPSPCTQN